MRLAVDTGDELAPALLAECLPVLCEERGETDDRCQGGAKIVRCGGSEDPDRLVGHQKFRGTCLDLCFKGQLLPLEQVAELLQTQEVAHAQP